MSSESLRSLQEIVARSPAPSESEAKLVLTRLAAEVSRRTTSGTSSDSAFHFYLDCVKTLGRMRGPALSNTRLECLFDCYKYFFLNGNSKEALEVARAMQSLASQTKSTFWLRKSHACAGVIFAEQHQVGDALVSYSYALELARRSTDVEGEIGTWINLGIALNYGGLYREALPCLNKALQILRTEFQSKELEASAFCNIAQSHYHLGNLPEGLNAIEQCLAASRPPESTTELFQRAVRELTFVQISLALGRPQLAQAHAAACVRVADLSKSEKPKFIAQLALGLVQVELGDVESGLDRLEAVAGMRAVEVQVLRADALQALVRAYSASGKTESALEALDALVQILKQSNRSGIERLSCVSAMEPDIARRSYETHGGLVLEAMQARLRADLAEKRLIEARIETLERMAVAAALNDDDSGEHLYRVGALASEIAAHLGWTRNEQRLLEVAARLHDIGKIAVRETALRGTSEPSIVESRLNALHAKVGSELLAQSDSPLIQLAEAIARCHHEWWNGKGVPSSLKGKRIPIAARIVAVADAFDSLTHGPNPLSIDEASERISRGAGSQFDPDLIEPFFTAISKLKQKDSDLDRALSSSLANSQFLQARNRIRRLLDGTGVVTERSTPPHSGNFART